MAKSLMSENIVIEDTRKKLTDIWYVNGSPRVILQSAAEENFLYHIDRVNAIIADIIVRPVEQSKTCKSYKSLLSQLFYNLMIAYSYITLSGRTYKNMEVELFKSLIIFIERHKDKYYAVTRLLLALDVKRYMTEKEKKQILDKMNL
jgi:hypothetical protein